MPITPAGAGKLQPVTKSGCPKNGFKVVLPDALAHEHPDCTCSGKCRLQVEQSQPLFGSADDRVAELCGYRFLNAFPNLGDSGRRNFP